jgi:hypothetical protein
MPHFCSTFAGHVIGQAWLSFMITKLPPTVAAFFQAHNTGQTDDFNALFTGDALVSDEAHEYRGAAIKGWIDGAIGKYKPQAQATDLAQVGDKTIVTAQVSGTFPGSPTQLRYNFTLKNGKIAALAIGT